MIDWLLMSWLPHSNIFASLYFLLSVFLRSAKIDCFWERTVTAWRVSDEGEARPRLRKDKDAIKELWLPLPPPQVDVYPDLNFQEKIVQQFSRLISRTTWWVITVGRNTSLQKTVDSVIFARNLDLLIRLNFNVFF